jgi:hypothetical protein
LAHCWLHDEGVTSAAQGRATARCDRPVAVVVEHVDCVARDIGKQWKQPYGPSDLVFRIEVEGDPSYAVELSFGTGGDALSAMPVLNSIPAVRQARPGLLGPLDVPRYWCRNVARA